MSTNPKELHNLIQADESKKDNLDGEQASPKKTIVAESVITTIENVQPADGEIKLKPNEEPEETNINKIKITKEVFEEIKKSLTETVKSMEKNPSIFSRAAKFWGELPLWQKILGGIALSLPTLIIGIVAHIGFLLAICGVTVITYAAGGIILDDHHQCSTSIVESLQKGILGLADLLELTINALDVIRQQLAAEIDKFISENARLSVNVDTLSQKIDALAEHVSSTAQITQQLENTKDGLGQVIDTIQGHTDLMEQNQKKLSHITESYNNNLSELANKIKEINSLKEQLAQEINNAKLVSDTLNGAITDLTRAAIGDENQREAFKLKLDKFLSDKEASFHQIAERISQAEIKLEETQRKLDEANDRYDGLLQLQKKQIERLECIGQPKTTSEELNSIGIFANKKMLNANQAIPAETVVFN